MSAKKDMRREDLIVPYYEDNQKKDKDAQDFNSTMSSTLPMAAMFTRNKLIGWTAIIFAVQSWLAETPAQKAAASSPAYFSVGMAVLSLGVAYLPLFLPPPPGGLSAGVAGSGTETPPAVPK